MNCEYEKPLNVDIKLFPSSVNIKSFPGKVVVKDIDKLNCLKILTAKGPKGDQGEPGAQGVSVKWIRWIEGDHRPGTFDTYRIMLTDDTYTDFQVYNGQDSTLTIEYDTCENWDAKPTYGTVPGGIYIYTDKYVDKDGRPVPSFKFGTGGQLINIPFVDAVVQEHIEDEVRHITEEERTAWNNKERGYASEHTLILTKN